MDSADERFRLAFGFARSQLLDVDGAFTRCDVSSHDVHQFATDVPAPLTGVVVEVEQLLYDAMRPEVEAILRDAQKAAADELTGGRTRRRGKTAGTPTLTIMYLTGTFGHVVTSSLGVQLLASEPQQTLEIYEIAMQCDFFS